MHQTAWQLRQLQKFVENQEEYLREKRNKKSQQKTVANSSRTRNRRKNISRIVREGIYARDNYKCLKCLSMLDLTIDHVIPLFKDGPDDESNFQTLCYTCNQEKSIDIIDYRK